MSIKKIFLGVAAVALVLSASVSIASADELSDLQAQIQLLMNQIAALQGGGSAGGSASMSVPIGPLNLGSRGAQVTALQTFLVSKGLLTMPVGVAMGYYGNLTKAAVAAYQSANGLPSVGRYGPLTQTSVSANIAAMGPGPGPISSGCPIGQFNPLTGQPCGTPPVSTTCPIGQFNPLTGQPCSTTPTSAPSEGSITASLSTTPVPDSNIRKTTNVPVWGIEIDAIGSDMTVDRVDLQVSVTPSGGSASNPGAFVKKIAFFDGSTLLKEMAVSSSDFNKDSSDRYHVIISGINFKVPKGTTKNLTVNFDVTSLNTTDANRVVAVQGYAGNSNNVRATDTAGFQSYADMSGSANTRSHTFKPAGASTVTVSTNSGLTPLAKNNKVSTANGVSKLTMLALNAKSENGDSKITKVYVQINATATAGLPDTLYLTDEAGTVLGTSDSTSVANGSQSGFTGLSIPVAQDTTKVLLLKADYPTTAGGQAASTTLVANSVQWEQPDGSTSSTTPGSAFSSKDQYLYGSAPVFALNGTPSVSSVIDSGTSISTTTLTFKIPLKMTASGGSMVKPVIGDFVLYFASTTATSTYTNISQLAYNGYSPLSLGNAYAATSTALFGGSGDQLQASTTVSLDGIDPTVDPAGDGSSYTFTLTGTLKNRSATGNFIGIIASGAGTKSAGNYRMILVAASSTVGAIQFTPQYWALDGFETPTAFLPN